MTALSTRLGASAGGVGGGHLHTRGGGGYLEPESLATDPLAPTPPTTRRYGPDRNPKGGGDRPAAAVHSGQIHVQQRGRRGPLGGGGDHRTTGPPPPDLEKENPATLF